MSPRRPLRSASTHRGRPGRRWRWCRRRPPGVPSGPSGHPPATWSPSPQEPPAPSAAPTRSCLHHTSAAPSLRCQAWERHRTVITVPLRSPGHEPDRADSVVVSGGSAAGRSACVHVPWRKPSRVTAFIKPDSKHCFCAKTRVMYGTARSCALEGVHPDEASLLESWASRNDG